ncbi:MAG TPA: class I SAM-dependent methyltransferase [Bacillota bacterium]|nr:class I SAM-dependent methyltransferase [Bacillota bacterium]HUM57734.1 class I SAM-dependent methyltransferase [Bacillota bacterium]
MAPKGLGSAVYLAHMFLSQVLGDGGTGIDATAGNGHDTVFLASLVGPRGKVYAFDIQSIALQNTRLLLEQHGYAERVQLFQAGHEEMEKFVSGPVDAVIFNLGYLPGCDHGVTSSADTTVKAVQAALNLLRSGGRVSIVVYTGHPGGIEEYQKLEEMASALDGKHFHVLRINFLNRSQRAPSVIVIEKAGFTP